MPINPQDMVDVEMQEEEEGPIGEVYDLNEQIMREKITHVLTTYPLLSNSMLQVGVGASLEPRMWKPVLAKMIRMREITQENYSNMTPNGRAVTSIRLYLTSMEARLNTVLHPAS